MDAVSDHIIKQGLPNLVKFMGLIVILLLSIDCHLIYQKNANKKATESGNASNTGPTAFGLLLQGCHDPTFQTFSERCQDLSKEADKPDSHKSDTGRQKPKNDMSS